VKQTGERGQKGKKRDIESRPCYDGMTDRKPAMQSAAAKKATRATTVVVVLIAASLNHLSLSFGPPPSPPPMAANSCPLSGEASAAQQLQKGKGWG
jgi:hypothetical protein